MKLFEIIILLSTILFSCNQNENEKNTKTVEKYIVVDKKDLKIKKEDETKKVYEIKRSLPIPEFEKFNQFCETFGSSYLSKKYLYRPKKKGFFGAYHLYDRIKHVKMGFLITHNTIDDFHEWKFSDTTQTFIALIMKRGGSRLKLFEKIGVSDKKEKLFDFFGEPQIENDTMIVYWDKQRTIGQFKIENGKITEFIYGRYNDNIKLPVTENELKKINVW